ncbi:MAG: hypothetical protein RBT66_04890 [bacterium]|jgi:hypothetical protein|nr:hypothetical protein [bacterium]
MKISDKQLEEMKRTRDLLNDLIRTAQEQHKPKKEEKLSLEEIEALPHDIKNLNRDPRVYPGKQERNFLNSTRS